MKSHGRIGISPLHKPAPELEIRYRQNSFPQNTARFYRGGVSIAGQRSLALSDVSNSASWLGPCHFLMIFSDYYRRPRSWFLLTLPAIAAFYTFVRQSHAEFDVPILLLGLLCIGVGCSRNIKIPYVKGQISLSEGFVFISMLLFPARYAILLSLIAAACATLPVTRKRITLLVNVVVAGISTTLIMLALKAYFGSAEGLLRGNNFSALLVAICTIAFLKSLIQAGLVSITEAYRSSQAIWVIWARNYFWTSVTYFGLTIGATLFAKLIYTVGVYPAIAAISIAAVAQFVFSTYLNESQPLSTEASRSERLISRRKEREELFRSAFDGAAIGMALVSPKGRWLLVNHSLCEILGYEEQELLISEFQNFVHPDDLGASQAKIKHLLKGKMPNYQMEKRYLHKAGHEVWVLWSVSLVRDSDTELVHLIFQIQDITDRKCAEERLLHDAFHDVLTGLPNRALFIDHLKLAISRSLRRRDQLFAVLFLDLDRFKIINDSLGHMIGDQLLIGIARRLETCLRPGDTVARVGGDEFTILLEEVHDNQEAVFVAERIQKELATPFSLSGREVFTTVSIGIAPSSTGYDQPEDILRDADTAMYRAKSLGKARHEVFDKTMHAFAINLLQLETDMRRAIERQEFFLQYQPIVALDDFKLRGFEALVRWQHPERGMISPLDFIPVAEDTGQILAIGEWVLREACRQMRRWQKRFPSDPPLFISVNLSVKQFSQPNMIEQVKTILEETRIDPHSLKLEITESVVMENVEAATALLKQLRAVGVQLSIDDFGTGYSSLSYLHRFPINTLKIDRSFVTRIVDNNENIEIVRTIVMLARNLGLDVVAEGVETNEQLALLRKLECENGQGHFFSRPTGPRGAEKIISDTYILTDATQRVASLSPARPTLVA